MSLYTLNEKNAKKRPLLYEKKCMKVYLNDEKTPVDLRLLYNILWGLKALCGKGTRVLGLLKFLNEKDSHQIYEI